MQDNIIHRLSEQVINQIAAGEVIQRPSSVVKELMENAIDAGADKIDVIIKDAGRTLIQVVDNGKGMSKDDALIAFERHATSKITTAEDLFKLRTMGFRGEALSSIAAIAHIELKTRRPDDEVGWKLTLSDWGNKQYEPVSCASGCNFCIRDLFYNVPARRKFLKSEETEMRNILQTFTQIALVYEQISFSITHNDKTIYQLSKSNRKQRIASLMGEKIGKQLLSVNESTEVAQISGFIGLPESAQRKSGHQFFFVNGRYIQHPYFQKAICSAYEKIIPAETRPAYFVYFEVAPEKLDVNIHPTKTEVKFADEVVIYQLLASIARKTLGSANIGSPLDFDQDDAPQIPVFSQDDRPTEPTISIDTHYDPFRSSSNSGNGYVSKPPTENWQSLYKGILDSEDVNDPEIFSQQQTQNLRNCFQFARTYMVEIQDDRLIFIHQHRAHTRILYEMFLRNMQNTPANSQQCLFPEEIALDANDNLLFEELRTDLEAVGYRFESVGECIWAINGIPAVLPLGDAVSGLKNTLETAAEATGQAKESLQSSIALSLARRGAIRAGETLSAQHMQSYIDELYRCDECQFTPDGLKISFTLPIDSINAKLG